jgi:TrmH family RNA methyltransferase
MFLVEGIHLVGAALEAGWPIECLLYSPELLRSDFGERLLGQFGGRSEAVSAAAFEGTSAKENPSGILAIARRRPTALDSILASGFGAALVSPQDPGNVGTILRTLDAVGGSALILLEGGVDPFHPTSVRAGMGASFVIPVIEASLDDFDAWRRRCGFHVVGSSSHALTDYREVRPAQPWILMLGNEQKGLSEDQQRLCDVVVGVPMKGRAKSLNLAVASGILLFEYAAGISP